MDLAALIKSTDLAAHVVCDSWVYNGRGRVQAALTQDIAKFVKVLEEVASARGVRITRGMDATAAACVAQTAEMGGLPEFAELA
jgi:hypothetical protein